MVCSCITTLHLFAGGGGGVLADRLLGRDIVGAIEIEKYPREILLSRQADGLLPLFPIWDDVTTFRADNPDTKDYIEGLRSIRQHLCIAGGFPCQGLSIAGKGAGLEDPRSGLWSEMRRIIGEVGPRYIFVENSPMLVVRGLDRVLGDIAELGFACRWGIVGADDSGAPHRRKRFWLWGENKAYSDTHSDGRWGGYGNGRRITTEDNFRGVSLKWLVEKRPDKYWSANVECYTEDEINE